jgi:pimeloyl-ACP methyl ester carboxylesterase
MTERVITLPGGVELCVEPFGDAADPALLLVGGAAASMDWWDVAFCERLAAGGRYVVRYDHRDTGRSSASPAGAPTYSGDDLATDPLAILDALGVARAHLAGLSMGGGITQQLAAHHPDRLLSLTLISSSPAGERQDRRDLPPPAPRVAETFADPPPAPDWDDRDAVVTYLVEGERPYAGSLGFDEQRVRRVARVVVDRTRDIAATMTNHWLLAGESGQPFRLADIGVRTLVLHGTDDPMFPLAHGEALAAEIPDATLVPLEGMGHQVPPPVLWDVVVPALLAHTAQRSRRTTNRRR